MIQPFFTIKKPVIDRLSGKQIIWFCEIKILGKVSTMPAGIIYDYFITIAISYIPFRIVQMMPGTQLQGRINVMGHPIHVIEEHMKGVSVI